MTDYNADWQFKKEGGEFRTVTLPHDAMLEETRLAEAKSGSAQAYYPGGKYIYEKHFSLTDEQANKHITFVFGGVYKNAKVFINDTLAEGAVLPENLGDPRWAIKEPVKPISGTIDFQDLCMVLGKGGPWAVNDGGDAGFTVNEAVMHYLGDYAEQGDAFVWGNRFAYEYVEGRGKFTFRNKSNKRDSNCGMFSWDFDHIFSILGLKDGDKVTITTATGTTSFVSTNVTEEVEAGAKVESNKTYTIKTEEETTRLDISMAKATLISKIVIEPYGVEVVPTVSVDRETLALVPGATQKLVGSVDPASAVVVWASSNESVATVAEDGTITAVGAGTANVTLSWKSETSDAEVVATCVVTVADVDFDQYEIATEYDFRTMGDVTLELAAEAAGAIWNAANNTNNNVFFCTNEGLENIAVQAAVASNKGWSIVADKGLYLASGAGRCAAVGGVKADQIVEFIYTGDAFYTTSADAGINKAALNEATGRAIYKAEEDGMIGFELVKGNYVEKIVIYKVKEATGIESVAAAAQKDGKFFKNGQIFIVRGGRTFNSNGQVVK